MRGQWVRAGTTLVVAGLAGAAVPAVLWATGAGSASGSAAAAAAATAAGVLLGVLAGAGHLLVLRRALARQVDSVIGELEDIGGRLLGDRPGHLLAGDVAAPLQIPLQATPGTQTARVAQSAQSARAARAAEPGLPGVRRPVALGFPRPRSDAGRVAAVVPVTGGRSGAASAVDLLGGSSGASSNGSSGGGRPIEQAVTALLTTARCGFECGSLAEAPGDVVIVIGRDGRVRSCSNASATVLGWTADDLRGQPAAGLVHSADLATFTALVDGVLTGAPLPHRRTRLRVRASDGEWRVLEWAGSPAGDPLLVVLAGRDVTEQVQMEADLLHQASHDPLTGLPNRATLMGLAQTAVEAATPEQPLAVLMIDLDRFKDVNDSLGHAVGDELLAQVGPRLRSALRPQDSIARLGGDEFAVLLPAAGQDGARRVAERLAEALESPFLVDGMDLHVEASIGIAVSHRPGRPDTCLVEGLLREADIAMYRAKEEGAGIVLFEPEHDSGHGRSRLELSAELRRAVTEKQLVLHYQPVVDVVEGRLAGVEALVRWRHPERGLLAPGAFLPLAEQTGLILPLSRLVLAEAIQQAAAWQRAGYPVQIAVNMSPRWLQHGEVPDLVSAMLDEHELSPGLLRLEITESVVLAHPQHSLGMLTQLRDMGIGLSLDDFGTGYSSMTHLRNLPVDELKVDRGFVHAMTTSAEDAVIVRAAIELGHNLGMDVVAEGIEDADTLAEVVAAGCSLAQGYYFAQALAPEELIEWALERFPGFGNGDPASRRPHPRG